jgi:hypothetical protein
MATGEEQRPTGDDFENFMIVPMVIMGLAVAVSRCLEAPELLAQQLEDIARELPHQLPNAQVIALMLGGLVRAVRDSPSSGMFVIPS